MHNVMDRIKRRIGQRKRAETRISSTTKPATLPPRLPKFRESTAEEQEALFLEKLKLCSVTFDFNNEDPQDSVAKENKGEYLQDMIDHITETKSSFSDDEIRAILHMVSRNLFRPLPPSLYADFDPDDDPSLDPAWPHLQLVYEFLFRFVVSPTPDRKVLKKYIDRSFLINLMNLFDSEDPRERDYLRMILHRIYGKFMTLRKFIRRYVNDIFYRVIYETQRHNGIAVLLEIMGSIINGFALPLKEEHKRFLRNVLIPLHKVKTLGEFHPQLAYCVTQFIDKDETLASVVVGGMLKFWPAVSSKKELLFLNELEEVLEMSRGQQLEKIIEPLFTQIGAAICSPHFQVAERALFLWNNDIIAAFTLDHREIILPIVAPALHANSKRHWNPTVHSLTFNITRIFMEMDATLYDRVSKEYEASYEDPVEKQRRRDAAWAQLRTQAVVS